MPGSAGVPHLGWFGAGQPRHPAKAPLEDGKAVRPDHGATVIAAITTCTDTSSPEAMIAAALLAKKAAERGLAPKPARGAQPDLQAVPHRG